MVFAARLQAELGAALHAVGLFGSRARGEAPVEYSDVDLLVLVHDASLEVKLLVHDVVEMAARDLGLDALVLSFSLHINSLGWLEQRRSVRSFFIAEVEWDKVVVVGSPL